MKIFRALLIISTCIVFSCDKEKEVSPSQDDLLTGGSSKKWRLISNTEDTELSDESCTAASARNQDNFWIYSRGGRFEFDNGTNNGGDCDTCCSDMLDYYGRWKIENGKLKIIADGLIIEGIEIPNDIEQVVFNETLKELTKDDLVIQHNSYIASFQPSN